MKTLTVAAALLAALAFSHTHAAGRAHICQDLRQAVVEIAQARDAGTSQDSLMAQAEAAAAHQGASVVHVLRTAVALAFAQPDMSPEQFADDFVKRCGAYDSGIVP
jgi:hypothetical protein